MEKKVFILEDDPLMRKVLFLYLTAENYKVSVFESVGAFMKALEDVMPDIYLLDVCLPDGNGLEVAKTISSTKLSKPILMMSATEHVHWQKEGIVGFFVKPFDLKELKTKIQDLLK